MAELVVVVEDHPPVTGHAEVLEQHVAGEDVGRGQVLERVAPVDQGRLDRLGRLPADEDVERDHSAPHVHVPDHHVRALERDGVAGALQQLLEHLLGEARARELDVLELLEIDQPADPVVAQDLAVLSHHFFPGGGLGGRETVPNHLEDELERGQGEDRHHQARLARGDHEALVRGLDHPHQVAEELGLAVLVVAERDVELGDPLARQDRVEKADHLARALEVGVEVPAREAEDDARLVLAAQHRVNAQPLLTVEQRKQHRQQLLAAAQAADQVGRLVADEDRAQDVEGLELGRAKGGDGARLDALRGQPRVLLQVPEGGPEVCVLEHFVDHPGVDAAHRVHAGAGHLPAAVGKRQLGRDVVDRRIDSHVRKDAAGERVEVGLGELEIVASEDGVREGRLQRLPGRSGLQALAELLAQRFEGLADRALVQLQAARRIAPDAVPIAPFEALFGAPGDGPEAGVVVVEAAVDDVRGARRLGGGDLFASAGRGVFHLGDSSLSSRWALPPSRGSARS